MKFVSTRNAAMTPVDLKEAVLRGLAPDGGLFRPAEEVNCKDLIASFNRNTEFTELSAAMIGRLFPEVFSREKADIISRKAFPFAPALTELNSAVRVLELFHGPSCAFKDFGASFLAAAMEQFLAEEGRRAVILTATSGDTGSAAAQAFKGRENIDVVILYPSARVSPLQEKQLTTVGGNVLALEVGGSFDDCQKMVKEVFTDPALQEKLPLTSANSINLGRLVPQAFYYLYAFALLKEELEGEIYYSVPSGNFGNLTAAVYAWRWGMPANGFIAAVNANDVVPEYLQTGIFSPRPSVHTLSNAMDVGNPSNFERLQEVFSGNVECMRSMIHGETVTDDQTLEAMKRIFESTGRFVDPHTAVGILSSERFLEMDGSEGKLVVTLATAHPGKFGEIVEEATGRRPDIPPRLARVMELPKKSVKIDNRTVDLAEFLLDRFA